MGSYSTAVRAGITCLWQVNGRSDVDFEKWMKLDLKYIDEWSPMLDIEYIQEQSLFLDLKILLKTLPAVLSHKVAY